MPMIYLYETLYVQEEINNDIYIYICHTCHQQKHVQKREPAELNLRNFGIRHC